MNSIIPHFPSEKKNDLPESGSDTFGLKRHLILNRIEPIFCQRKSSLSGENPFKKLKMTRKRKKTTTTAEAEVRKNCARSELCRYI